MVKNVMKLLKPSPHRARNDFDLSHRHLFDANFGELLPATCIETVPGDNITLHASDLLRAIPFVSSPFLRAKQHLDVWFVPYHDLWHNFDQFVSQREEPVSAALHSAKYLPHTSQFDLYNAINTMSGSSYNYKDVVGRSLSDRSYYLLELLGYGDIGYKHATQYSNSFKINLFRLAAYNYIWYNEYRQQYYDDGTRLYTGSGTTPAALFNFDDLLCDSVNNSRLDSTVATQRARIAAMSQLRYRCWKKDLFTGVLPSTQFGNVSSISLTGSGTASFNVPVTFEGNTSNDFQRHYWFSDSYSDIDNISQIQGDLSGVGTLFESSMPSVSVPSGSISNKASTNMVYDSQGSYTALLDDNGRPIHNAHSHSFSGSSSASGTVSVSSGSFDVLGLRKAEALQIWRENALRAGNRVTDNMMAHYGVASDFNDHRPTYLGSVSSPLNIGDIAATANSTSGINTTVGDIAGKGLSSLDEKVFKFHAKDFGVIMVMFSMLPEAEYDGSGIERTNQLLESEDFFVPEFENLGLEAVAGINIFPRGTGVTSDSYVFGYAPRYFGYKTKLDKVFGKFVGSGIFRSWSSQRSDVSATLGSQTTYSMPLSLLYVNPAIFNSNFNVSIDVSPQFLCDLYFDIDAVRPMSVMGLPFS